RGSQNDRDALERLVLLQPRAEHVAVGGLGLDANDDQVRVLLLRRRHPLLAVGGHRGGEAARLDGVRKSLCEAFVRIDEEDSFRHEGPGFAVRVEAYGRNTRSVNETMRDFARVGPSGFPRTAPTRG